MNESILFVDPRTVTLVLPFNFCYPFFSDGPDATRPNQKGHWDTRPEHDRPDQVRGVQQEVRSYRLRVLPRTRRLLEEPELPPVGRGRAKGRRGQDHRLGT